MDIQKKLWINVKLHIGLIVFFLGLLFTGVTAKAAALNAFDYMPQMYLGGIVWMWNDAPEEVTVAKNKPIDLQCILNFTNNQGVQIHENGVITLQWELPDGVEIAEVSDKLSADLDGNETLVGSVSVTRQQIQMTIMSQYREYLNTSSITNFTLNMQLKFSDGTHKIADRYVVNASDYGSSNVEWSYDTVFVKKYDIEDDTTRLGNARFIIKESKYVDGAYTEPTLFRLSQNQLELNQTFLREEAMDGFVTVEGEDAAIKAGFQKGNIYYLEEAVPPVGYLPSNEELKFAFYYYDGEKETGVSRTYYPLNQKLKERYEAAGVTGIFGKLEGYGTLDPFSLFVANKKIPQIQFQKLDGMTKKAMKGVQFTLQISAAKADYAVSEYQQLGWNYDSTSQLLQYPVQTTDGDGLITYPQGAVPYCSQMYELVEKVPQGYEGYGGTKSIYFKMTANENGVLELSSDDAQSDTINEIATLKIVNEPVAEIEILKVNEEGKKLEGAVFSIYGETQKDGADTIEKSGKTYYQQQQITTGKDGVALFGGLRKGTYYLKEDKAPNGYRASSEEYRIQITEDIIKDGKYSVEIINKKTGTPTINTGGKGIFKNIMIGILLFAAGSVLFIMANKKKLRKMLRRARHRAAVNHRRAAAQQAGRRSGQRRRPPQRRPKQGRPLQHRRPPQRRKRR